MTATETLFERTLCDGLLRISATGPAAAWLHPWLPLNADSVTPAWRGADEPMQLEVGVDASDAPAIALRNVIMRMNGVDAAWVGPDEMAFAGAVTWGGLDLSEGCGRVVVRTASNSAADPTWEVFATLTMMSALLLGRSGRALVHAGAVQSPSGDAVLLIGDAFAGKTTTIVNLVRNAPGWRYLSDDHVVLSADRDRIRVEGWTRNFHLDEGWEDSVVTRRRRAVSPGSLAIAWSPKATLVGCVLPAVRGDVTRTATASAGEVLTALIRQSPWLAADRAAGAPILGLLQRAATLPLRARLDLAMDSYREPALLVREWNRLYETYG